MKRIITSVLTVFILITTVCSVVGCTAADMAKDNAAYVVVAGIHSNGEVIPFNSETVQSTLSDISYKYAYVTFINCDSDPEPFFQSKIPEPAVKNLSEEKKKEIAESYIRQMTEILQAATPDSGEVDTLKAISKSAQALEDLDDESYDKELLILDSGLSTSGYLDFTKGYLYADPQSIVSELKKANAIPKLSGTNVSWAFCGEVASPQKELTADEKDRLKAIWEAILNEAGAKSVTFKNDFSGKDAYMNLPLVSTVEVGEEIIDPDIPDPIETMVLDDASVEFVGNKAEFVNVEKAREAMQVVADQLIANPENVVYVIGTTASGRRESNFCNELSTKRAQACVDLLKEMGIDESRMIPLGLGYENYWHVSDLDSAGNLIEDKASQNRKVLIIDINSEDALHVPQNAS